MPKNFPKVCTSQNNKQMKGENFFLRLQDTVNGLACEKQPIFALNFVIATHTPFLTPPFP